MAQIALEDYLSPDELAISSLELRRVLLVGHCIFEPLRHALSVLRPEVPVDHFTLDQLGPGSHEGREYDLRIAQVPLRAIYPESHTMPLAYDDLSAHEQAFSYATESLAMHLNNILDARLDCATFVLNYMVPQQNIHGRLTPRYDLRNPVYFVEMLNAELSRLIGEHPNVYLMDVDQLSAALGRRLFQDDPFWITAHGGLIGDFDWHFDQDRLEPAERLSSRYEIKPDVFGIALWNQAFAMLRTLRGLDRVKMVCVDLDDTLWRGVIAEGFAVDHSGVEGWPLGFAEALSVLARRGIVLAIVSRNDENGATETWKSLYGARLPLELFPIRKISWRDKVEGLCEAIAEANFTPDSVLFIDDNPVERAHAMAALPGLRALGGRHLDWRRILLWSPETQVGAVSKEAAQRNRVMGSQVARERRRAGMSREEFLLDLNLRVKLERIVSSGNPRFARALELINRTNQFNTTGNRWTQAGADRFFDLGGGWIVAAAEDRYVQYGMVGVLLLLEKQIVQYVISCRVFGLGVDRAVLAAVMLKCEAATALLIETPRNEPCRDIFRTTGWTRHDDLWNVGPLPSAAPHVTITWEDGTLP